MSTLTEAVRTSSTGGTAKSRAKRTRSDSRRAASAYYWMVWPAVIAFAAFHTLPVVVGIFFSFTNYAGYGDWNFVGLSNYANLFRDDRVLQAYGFSFLFAIVATVLTNAISLAIALGLNAKIKARNFFRGVYFVPYVLAILVIGYVFQFFFSNSLPKILSGIPLFADNILTNETWAWTAIVTLAVWQACAFSIIIYLSGLQTIPAELYEAASLDGASAGRQFWSITFPLISAFFTINVVLSLKGFLQVFDPIVALTNGGPGTATESVTLLIFRGGFSGGEFAYQTANAVVFFIVITVISLLQFRVLQRREAEF
ncbi:raffinose/stachyose/melibiose transport system permease protein [Microbacterium terrae]|uniref:Sn-glycerol-3-phosphate transport system permease protein UgpA n=1 Tax=Microbacterium terrae TaxID=69369 RepID=A0A0M2H401_9MICO|nr:sugar ABC transporter permease [Microbacterium terrae]KJL38515.1 sn-glycerol-3-phosphate transport system permease protein UgpA [Microbacterium terrae]MBP1078842.1 raffinose/stachyose/melibiose transport system permease protein [Microbacterium terrae]GLJ98242.1 sugar ABC transporter permease [Microbacterium terrae]